MTERQRRRIVAAAEARLASHADDLASVLVARWRVPRHIPAAFDVT